MVDVLLGKNGIGFEIFDLQPRAADIGASNEVDILFAKSIRRALPNCLDRPRRARIFLRGLRPMPWQRLAALMRMRRSRHPRSLI
jgi:hypothetical protein